MTRIESAPWGSWWQRSALSVNYVRTENFQLQKKFDLATARGRITFFASIFPTHCCQMYERSCISEQQQATACKFSPSQSTPIPSLCSLPLLHHSRPGAINVMYRPGNKTSGSSLFLDFLPSPSCSIALFSQTHTHSICEDISPLLSCTCCPASLSPCNYFAAFPGGKRP